MKIEAIKKALSDLFVVRDEKEDPPVLCFNSEYMNRDNAELHQIYEIVSNAMHDSGLTHGFSYEIASCAVNVLDEVEDWEDDDALQESIDSYIPIYNSEITGIYQSNSWAVDEARQEYGAVDSIKDAQMAWYKQISSMVYAIKSALEDTAD